MSTKKQLIKELNYILNDYLTIDTNIQREILFRFEDVIEGILNET